MQYQTTEADFAEIQDWINRGHSRYIEALEFVVHDPHLQLIAAIEVLEERHNAYSYGARAAFAYDVHIP